MSTVGEITVNGDCAPDLLKKIRKEAAGRDNAVLKETVRQEQPLHEIGKCDGEELSASEYMALLRSRIGVDPDRVNLPSGSTVVSKLLWRVRKLLWKLLRYQHDHMFFQQSAVNYQLISAIERESGLRKKEADELRARVAGLEKKLEGRDL